MEKYIPKSALIAEIERLISNAQIKLKESEECNDYESYVAWAEHIATCINVLSFIDTLEVKDVNSVWHNIDDIPNYNLNGISDLIVDSCYGHIYGEAHSYTPEQWAAHIRFNANRQFRWAYENDLIDFD